MRTYVCTLASLVDHWFLVYYDSFVWTFVLFQGLLDGLHHASFWNNTASLISVHALCLGPRLQAVLQLAEHGDLHRYMQRPTQNIRTCHLFSIAEQIAQALRYLVSYTHMYPQM